MQINIDYIGFTIKREAGEGDTEWSVLDQVGQLIYDRYPSFREALGSSDDWKWGAGRKPYRASWQRTDGTCFIFLHPALDHALIEIPGKGCQSLGLWHDAGGFLEAFKDRLTRLDLACDMLTDTRPVDFAYTRDAKRFKSHGHITEESGETVYIGSRKSDRHAAIYRYNEPHERAHLLRCEYRLRAENAKITADFILTHGHAAAAKALGEQFGWQHPDWNVTDPSEAELRAYRPDRKAGKTLFWLGDTVAPLLIRLHQEKTFNVFQWLRENVLDHLEDDTTFM